MTDSDWLTIARGGGWVSAQQAMELRVRIAELELDLSEAEFCTGCNGGEWTWERRAEEAEARLAAVIALCDEFTVNRFGFVWVDVDMVRAAATGDMT